MKWLLKLRMKNCNMRLFLLVLIGLLAPSATPWAFDLAEVPGRQVCSPRCPRLRPVCHAVPNAGNGGVSPNSDVPPSLGLAEILKLVGATEEEKRLVEATDVRSGADLCFFYVEDWERILSSPLTARKLALIGEYIKKSGKAVTSSTTLNDMLLWRDYQTQLPTVPLIQDQYKGLQRLPPFDLSHINSIELDHTWIDNSYGMGFVGRHNFSEEVALEIVRLFRNPPDNPKTATALVFSSVSGIGKTVSMLQLKKTLPLILPLILPQGPNIVVAYLGFNTGLELGAEERKHMVARGEDGAEEVLARRLLASVLLSKKYGEVITRLPTYLQVYEGRGFPTVKQSREMLLKELGASPENPFYIVAGVDEVQRLNSKDRFTFEGAELGRYFIRTLRKWQFEWNKLGLTVLGLGTGVTLNFSEIPTIGKNKALLGGDTVFISKDDFRQVVRTTVEKVMNTDKDKYSKCFENADSNTVIGLMASAYWPRVRILEYWKDGKDQIPIEYDPNWQKWPVWLKKWMRNEDMDVVRDRELLPGTINGEVPAYPVITVLFQYTTTSPTKFSVIPDGYSSSTMIEALNEQLPVERLYQQLDKLTSVDPRELGSFLPRNAVEFEDLGFHAVGTSLYIGLHALAEREITNPSGVQQRRLGLALKIAEYSKATTVPPEVVGITSLEWFGDYYPFVDSRQETFLPWLKEKLTGLLDQKKPLYLHTGRQTCFDYVYLYPTEGRDSWVAIVVDAKQTVGLEGQRTVTGKDQKNLYKAAVKLHVALQEHDMSLTHVFLYYLTNRDGLADSAIEELQDWRRQANKLYEGIELQPLNRATFEFPPYSDILFSRH